MVTLMKRPSFQFYPGDLRANVKLRRCSWAARGVWLEIMCLFHDSDEYGLLRWTLDEVAQAVGCSRDLVFELAEKGVLKGSDKVGEKVSFSESFSQRNAPSMSVVLIDEQPAPLWYSSRMVRDEYVRNRRAVHGIKSLENPNVPKKVRTPNGTEKDGEKDGDKDTYSPSPSSSSSSSSSLKEESSYEDLSSAAAEDQEDAQVPDKKKRQAIPYDLVVDKYHEHLPELPRVAKLTPRRKRAIAARCAMSPKTQEPEFWDEFYMRVRKFKRWMEGGPGQDGTWWAGADFDFLMREDKFLKVAEENRL